jgi:alanyl-tRNA synthetase
MKRVRIIPNSVKAKVIVQAIIKYITKGELSKDYYNTLYNTYGLTTKQVNEILDRYDDLIDELLDQYQDILEDYVIDRL